MGIRMVDIADTRRIFQRDAQLLVVRLPVANDQAIGVVLARGDQVGRGGENVIPQLLRSTHG